MEAAQKDDPFADPFFHQSEEDLTADTRLHEPEEDFTADTLFHELEELLMKKADLFHPVIDQVKAVQEELRCLRKLLWYTAKWCTKPEKMKDLSRCIEDSALPVMWHFYFNIVNMDENMQIEMKFALNDLLQKIETIKQEIREYIKVPNLSGSNTPKPFQVMFDFLQENMKRPVNCEANMKNQVKGFHKVLGLLRISLLEMLNQSTENKKVKDILMQLEVVFYEVGCILILLKSSKMNGCTAREMNFLLSDLLQEVVFVKQRVDTYVKVTNKSPRSNELLGSYLDYLLQYVQEVLDMDSQANLNHSVRDQVRTVQRELELLRKCLRDRELKELARHIRGVAEETEYIVDSIVLGYRPAWYYRLSDVEEELKLIGANAGKVSQKEDDDSGLIKLAMTSRKVSSKADAHINEVFINFEAETKKVVNQIVEGPAQLKTISVVGMAGIGKTTLVKKIYNHHLVVPHFYCRVWCCVSHLYRKRDLLLCILHLVSLYSVIELNKMSDEILAEELHTCLKGKRYLIVMDDIWNVGIWDELKEYFPDNEVGSRIIITSQLKDVTLQAEQDSSVHQLSLLSDEESWDLLQRKVFHEGCCDPKLESLGRKIARKSHGLPFAIAVISGLLAMTCTNDSQDRVADLWEEVAEDLESCISGDPQQCMGVLEVSYKYLATDLKPCFLYCGIFLENRRIPVSKLIQLWIAEGFVQEGNKKRLEDEAEKCIMDLIDRSLLLVSDRKACGRVKTCHINLQLRDFCLRKAEEEQFFMRIKGDQQLSLLCTSSEVHYDTSDDDCSSESIESFSDAQFSSPMIFLQHRLCIDSDSLCFEESSSLAPRVRSLLWLTNTSTDASTICCCFKLVRVLDLASVNVGELFPNEIELLVHLRYLAVQGYFTSVPSSINNLRRLEALHMNGLGGQIELPHTIFEMKKLRHLHVCSRAWFSPTSSSNIFSWIWHSMVDSNLDSLQTFSTPVINKNQDIIKRFPNLLKLRCEFSESWDSENKCNDFPDLQSLTSLESLRVSYNGQVRHPCVLSFPKHLKKLTLSDFHLPWAEMSAIGKLPNLEVLKLLKSSFEGKRWDTNCEFPKLRLLKLSSLDIAEWNVSGDNFPCIQQLLVHRCEQLEEIPSSFETIPTLQMIEVNWCSLSLVKSAEQILEKQQNIRTKVPCDTPPKKGWFYGMFGW